MKFQHGSSLGIVVGNLAGSWLMADYHNEATRAPQLYRWATIAY
jgi:hypothetical protein